MSNQLSTVILNNENAINLDLLNNTNYIIVTDCHSDDIKLNLNRDVNSNVVLFSKSKSNVNLNVTVNENVFRIFSL